MSEAPKTIQIQYFAVLREQRGLDQETLSTSLATPGALYRDLQERHGLTLPLEMLKVAVNQVFQPMDTCLADGDRVVFIPPVAGG